MHPCPSRWLPSLSPHSQTAGWPGYLWSARVPTLSVSQELQQHYPMKHAQNRAGAEGRVSFPDTVQPLGPHLSPDIAPQVSIPISDSLPPAFFFVIFI